MTGNSCERGEAYARAEVTSPMRTVTSIVTVSGSVKSVISVKTKEPIPKDKIEECMRTIKNVTVGAPVKVGDVIINDVASTGIDVIATSNAKVSN